MIKSAFIYLSLMGMMIGVGNSMEKSSMNPRRNIPFLYMFIPCLFFAFIFGCRYGVGVDHLDYVSSYLYGTDRTVEPLYSFIESLFKSMDFHFAWFFGFIAFLQITLFLSSVKDRYLYPFLILLLFFTGRWLGWCNGIRQATACCFFVFSVQFIENRKIVPYLVCCLFAFLFHRSAIILFPFYFINKVDFFKVKWVPWVVYGVATIMASTSFINDYIELYFSSVSEF